MAEGQFSRNDITYYWKEERGAGSNTRSLHFYQSRQLSNEEFDKIKKEKKAGKKVSTEINLGMKFVFLCIF